MWGSNQMPYFFRGGWHKFLNSGGREGENEKKSVCFSSIMRVILAQGPGMGSILSCEMIQ